MLSEFQKKKFTHYFYLWDVEHKGYFTYEDFSALLRRIRHMKALSHTTPEYQALQKNTEDFWGALQKISEKRTERTVTLEEWLIFCDLTRFEFQHIADNNIPTPMIEAIFRYMDVNNDNAIELSEWQFFLYAWNIHEDVAVHFALLDQNQDGKISFVEFVRLGFVWIMSDNAQEVGNYLFGRF